MGGGHINDYTLLVRLGNDLPGAVTVHGEDALGEDPTEPAAEPSGHPLRTSLAGVQLKYSIRGDRLTVPVSGDGAWWIAKLPDPSLAELAANEFLTMRWLATAGFEVPTVHVVAAGSVTGLPEGVASADTPIFLIERFDRTHSGRIHVEDFAQLADVEPRLKYAESGATYDSLAAAVLTLTGEAGFDEFVRRLVAMIVAGNTDAHLKNWALIYRDGRTPQLSPVYDFHSLTVYTRFAYAPLALSLNGEKTAALLGPDDFRRLADRSGADPEKTALVVAETVARLRDAWSDELRETASDLFPALDEHYRRRIGSLPICG
jgi:serine/threonine-protein kinase HipA